MILMAILRGSMFCIIKLASLLPLPHTKEGVLPNLKDSPPLPQAFE
jgi:hypothetical protein